MTKKINRKQKWRNITLNKANIDEYLQDLYNDTSGNYITQGVSFNKDDNFQMSLLRNALISSGSFSGLVKDLLYAHFEKHGKLDETIWQPNQIVEENEEELGVSSPSSPPPSPVEDDDIKNEQENNDTTEPTEDDSLGKAGVQESSATTEEDKPVVDPKKKKNPPKKKPDDINQKRLGNYAH